MPNGQNRRACESGTYSVGGAASCTICPAGSACPDTDAANVVCEDLYHIRFTVLSMYYRLHAHLEITLLARKLNAQLALLAINAPQPTVKVCICVWTGPSLEEEGLNAVCVLQVCILMCSKNLLVTFFANRYGVPI